MEKYKNLGELRKSKGLTQKFVCEETGLSRVTMSKKEKRKSPVSLSEAYLLSKILNTDVDTILGLCRS